MILRDAEHCRVKHRPLRCLSGPTRLWFSTASGIRLGRLLPIETQNVRWEGGATQGAIGTAARRLAAARKVVVFTGAGVSQDSGIATFRDRDGGLWADYNPVEMASPEGFLRNPELVWRWYEHRFATVMTAQPNSGHRAIAELESILPQVVVVTQNIDGLHQAAGSSDVIELHGTIRTARCLSGGHSGFSSADLLAGQDKPPTCPECGALLRPDVVWFGEPLPHENWHRAQHLARTCDVLLMVGTSAVVYPASVMPQLALEKGATVIDVNTESDALSRRLQHVLRGPAGEVLPQLVAAVRERKNG